MSNFLVGMRDTLATIVLQNCRRAVTNNGAVVIIEWVMPTSEEAIDPFLR